MQASSGSEGTAADVGLNNKGTYIGVGGVAVALLLYYMKALKPMFALILAALAVAAGYMNQPGRQKKPRLSYIFTRPPIVTKTRQWCSSRFSIRKYVFSHEWKLEYSRARHSLSLDRGKLKRNMASTDRR